MATESLTALISAHKTTSASSSNALDSIVGRTPGGQVDAYFAASSTSSASAYVEYSFDLSAIPDGAEIDTVSCTAGGYTPGVSYYSTYTAQLYSGSVAKGNTGDVRNTAFATVATFDGGAWTRAELNDCRVRYAAQKSKYGGNQKCYMSGAQLTVTYTYQSEKFMMKLGGAWEGAARVFKKVSGIWVEQTELANVVEDGVRYKNGGEYVAPRTVTITGTGDSGYCYAIINGVKYFAPATVQADVGTVISATVSSRGSSGTGIVVDGSTVVLGTGSYEYVVTDDCTVTLDYNTSYHTIGITTG